MKRFAAALTLAALLLSAACGGNSASRQPGPAASAPAATTGSAGSASPSNSATPAASASPTLSDGLPSPRTRMLLGAYTSLTGQSAPAALAAREKAMGRAYDLDVTYYNWGSSFPDEGEQAMAARGTAPMMAWYLPDTTTGSTAALSSIAAGKDDAVIKSMARSIKRYGHRVFLRLAPEMNGTWYKYSGDPAAYIAMWRHVHDVFGQVGVTDVTWVWCPNVNPTDYDSYYPGSRYVDVIGVDGFSDTQYTWETFQQLFGGFFQHFASFAPGKPQLVVETATNSGLGAAAEGVGSAATYIAGMSSYLKNTAGPKYDVIGVCWFDSNTDNDIDWRLNQTPSAYRAWLALARDPYFGGNGP